MLNHNILQKFKGEILCDILDLVNEIWIYAYNTFKIDHNLKYSYHLFLKSS